MKMSDSLLRLIHARDPNCPNESDILAYSENRLSRLSRARFERHFADCDDCRELLAFLARESDETPAPLAEEAVSEQTSKVLAYIQREDRNLGKSVQRGRASAGFYVSYPRLAAVGMVICAMAVAGVYLLTRTQAPADSAMEALRLAVKDRRYTEARVSGGLDHSRYAVTRGGDRNDDDLQFSRALIKLKSADDENAPAGDRLVLARVYLSRGTREDARHALTILTQLSAGGIETPEALNDAGVAQFQLGNYEDAIVYFTKALVKSPSYNEALFNKALAEERAHRYQEAKQDWSQFNEQSSDENWKAEARMHINSIADDR